jgi:CRP/FNR family transcriptional regulator
MRASSPPSRREPHNPAAADDGDEFRFCTTCAFSQACLSQGYAKPDLTAFQALIDHVGPFKPGEYIFREGDAFNAIAAVRGGTVKTFITDVAGNEQVLGFHLPGEVIGLNAIHPERYPCNAIALDTVTLCRFSFQQLSLLAARVPNLQQQLFKLLSLDIGKASLLVGDHSADERLAAFMVLLSQRYAARGFSATRFTLTMARADIANYLRLAPETVSRILKRFRSERVIEVRQRDVQLLDPGRLEALARPVLRMI